MQKSKYCDMHFSLNCPLCDETAAPNAAVAQAFTPPQITPTHPISTESPIEPPKPFIVPEGPQPPAIQSEEGQAVLSVTDSYARACDKHKQCIQAAIALNEHINKLQQALIELDKETAESKKEKDRLKKKVLETLAIGGDD